MFLHICEKHLFDIKNILRCLKDNQQKSLLIETLLENIKITNLVIQRMVREPIPVINYVQVSY